MSIGKIAPKFGWVVMAIILCAMQSVCFASDELTMKMESLEGGYSVRVPETFKTTHVSPTEDFVLYSMRDAAGKVILQIYVGNHPQDPIAHNEYTHHSSTTIGGFPATFLEWSCPQSLSCGDVRINVLESSGWPSVVHIFYMKLSADDLTIAKNIIDSFIKGPGKSRP